MSHSRFRYFHNPELARYLDQPCSVCGEGPPALNAIYFEIDEYDAVCLNCLASGRVPVTIPPNLVKRLEASLRETYPDLPESDLNDRIIGAVTELSRTPPVPWVQHNYWVVCHGDFAQYLGEWSQQDLGAQSEKGDGKAFLANILDPFPRSSIGDADVLWKTIGTGFTVVYVFECIHCSRKVALVQSY